MTSLAPRRHRITVVTLAALLSGSLLAGCSALSDDSAPAKDKQITTAFYPLAYATERIAGDHFTVINLTQPGKESHDLELSVKATADLADSALVVYEAGFQPAVDSAVEQNAKGIVIDAAEIVDLLEAEGDEHDHGDHDHDGHDHGELDLHFWLDPLRMAELADAIALELGDLDADNAEEYAANAATFRTELEALDADYTAQLAECERDVVVVNHAAFGYLARYGLHFEAITGLSPGAETTIADRARLEDLIAEEGVTTVFSEALGNTKTATTIAKDAGVRAEVLDPIEGLSDKTEDEDYLSLMRSNLAKLVAANGCQ